MGARQSRRSVDITTTPKKESIPAEPSATGEVGEKIEKLGVIEEADAKPTSNGVAPHTETPEDKEKDKDEASEKDQEKEKQPEDGAAAKEEEKPEPTEAEGTAAAVSTESVEAGATEATTPTEAAGTPASPTAATSPDTKEGKKKDKSKKKIELKKWSFRSISFSRKDKNKPVREATPKNGDVAKEEPLAEGGEETEAVAANATEAAVTTPEDKSTVSSPTEEAKEKKEESIAKPVATDGAAAPATEEPPAKKEEAVSAQAEPALTAVPVADKKVESVPETETIVENSTAKIEIVATENGIADEAPKNPPPAVPVEATQPSAPIITEDVASVTKAIEEIDISQKAVAAAVNENIESAGVNEIVADLVHQNKLNE